MARAVAATDWDVEVGRAKELTKATASNNHSECNSSSSTSASSDITTVIATSNSAAGCKNNGYVPISERCSNDSELEKLEEGLMSSDDIPSASVSGSASAGDTGAVVRENRGSCCNDSGAAGTAATTEGKEQRRGGSERGPLISVSDGEHDGDGRGGGGQV